MKTPTKIFFVSAILVAGSVLAVTIDRAVFNPGFGEHLGSVASIEVPMQPSQKISSSSPASTSTPTHLIIPSLGIDAKIQTVGITAKGNMGIPSNFTDVAWYKYGAIPGAAGSAVIAGHLNNGLGLNGVFAHLSDLKPGDDVFVVNKKGEKFDFEVRSIKLYDYTATSTDDVFAQTNATRLNLITCEGAWVKVKKTYDHRIVVFAELKV